MRHKTLPWDPTLIYRHYTSNTSQEPSTARSPSLSSSRSSLADDDRESSGIYKSQTNRNTAQSVFHTSRIGSRDVDFSDRLVGIGRQRKSYHVRRAGSGRDDENGSEESSKERIARLVREVEELKAVLAEEKDVGEDEQKNDMTVASSDDDIKLITELSKVLRDLQSQKPIPSGASKSNLIETITPATENGLKASDAVSSQSGSMTQPPPSAPSTEAVQAHTLRILSQATALEARLAALESLIGSPPTQAATTSSKPVLTQLTLLEAQVSSINSTSPSSLEAMSSQIQHLLHETSRLTTARQDATTALQKLQTQRSMGVPKGLDPASMAAGGVTSYRSTAGTPLLPESSTSTSPQPVLEDPDHLARVQKLYEVLSTIEATLPLVPAVVERLRTLQALHSDAARARQDLKDLERRQGEIGVELRKWRQGLEKLEVVIGEGRQGDEENREEIEKWVKELEEKLVQSG